MNLHQPLSVLPGVGPKSAEKFKKLGIETLEDLLLYFPFRYEDFKTRNVLELEDGEKAVISGVVATPANVQYYGYKRNRLRFSIKQGDQVIAVNFFNQPYLADKIEVQQTVAIFGKWDKAKGSLTGMKLLAQVEDDLQPVYRVTQGVSQNSLVKLIKIAFDQGLDQLLEENVPQILRERYQLMSRSQAVQAMHFPKDLAEYKQALRRVKFEELLFFQLQLQVLKEENHDASQGISLAWNPEKLAERKKQLPFELTQAQENSLNEILTDMASSYHMNRLLQGDVGSGKTVVAGLAMYAALSAGKQAALMVPTEILAEQHKESLQNLFPDLPIALLTGGLKAAEKREVIEEIASGTAQLIVGTHALIQEGVHYQDLGLVIIDEQHRFGVEQRAKLWRKNTLPPHILVMTATPIPRTLAMSVYGDLDVSVIDELPPGRKPIKTIHHFENRRAETYEFVKKEIDKGRQAYVVYPLIEESEALDFKNLTEGYEYISASFPLPKYKVSIVHGKLKPAEKDAEMERFVRNETQIMVATTVIEVGVNVPNASVMVIESAERFGLSQLHQLRGRVGRGSEQSYCILLTGNKMSSDTRTRMETMVRTNDGFEIAEVDLKLRGPGDLMGTQQSGVLALKIADIVKDQEILKAARAYAIDLLKADPDLVQPEHQCVAYTLDQLQRHKNLWKYIS